MSVTVMLGPVAAKVRMASKLRSTLAAESLTAIALAPVTAIFATFAALSLMVMAASGILARKAAVAPNWLAFKVSAGDASVNVRVSSLPVTANVCNPVRFF